MENLDKLKTRLDQLRKQVEHKRQEAASNKTVPSKRASSSSVSVGGTSSQPAVSDERSMATRRVVTTSTPVPDTDTDDSDITSLFSESESEFQLSDKEIDSSDSETAQDALLISQIRKKKDDTDSDNDDVPLSLLMGRSQLDTYLETSISIDAFNDVDMKSLSDTEIGDLDCEISNLTTDHPNQEKGKASNHSDFIEPGPQPGPSHTPIHNLHQEPNTNPEGQITSPQVLVNSSDEINKKNNTQNSEKESREPRKRKRDEKNWKRNIAQRQRNKGECYTARHGKGIPARKIRAGCGVGCRYKCHDKFGSNDRYTIFSGFWKLGELTRQRDYILKHVKRSNKQANKAIRQTNGKQKKYSLSYFFMGQAQSMSRVCKRFFLQTLDVSEQMVKTAFQKIDDIGCASSEKRGRYDGRENEDEKNIIRAHINSFKKVESHYCRRTSKKEYLESSLNLSKMHRIYVSERKEIGKKPLARCIYSNIFNSEFNLSFHHRSKDRCVICNKYEQSMPEEREALQGEYDAHMLSKQQVFEEKEKDKNIPQLDEKQTVAVFDLEEVLPSPKTNISAAYYMRKLNTYNLTVYDYGTRNVFCYLWPEYIASRGANEIASCVYQYLKEMAIQGKDKVILYSDCCTGQNRNRYMVTMMWYACKNLKLSAIEHKFLQTGHTFNEGDSAHAAIERASRNVDIYTPTQWGAVIRGASHRRKYDVHEMITPEFYDFKELSRNLINFEIDAEKNKVSWLKIRSIKITANDPNRVEIKYSFSEQGVHLDLFKKGRRSSDITSVEITTLKSLEPLSVDADKYLDLIKMCDLKIIPVAHHDYFRGLPHRPKAS